MKKKKDNIIIVISLIVICINHIVLSRHIENTNLKIHTQIIKPVIVVKKDKIIRTQIYENSFPIEYNFSICNYDENTINEADFEYVIELEYSICNFPVTYQLIDCDSNTEIKLIDGKSKIMKLKKYEQESRNFRLILNWRELDSDLADNLQINLKINAVQTREEKDNEIEKNSNFVNSSSSYT